MNVSRIPRIFYCGMVNTAEYAAMIAAPLHIGAASNKMIAVVRAMRDAGVRAYLVSMPVLGRKAHIRHVSAAILNRGDSPQIFLPVFANPYLRKIYSLFSFALFCINGVAKADRVILYNHAIEFIPGLMILVLKGNRPFLDIEDAARVDEKGWRGLIGRPLFHLFRRLTHERKLIVSDALAEMLGLRRYCVVYGATRTGTCARESVWPTRWGTPETPAPIKIHYGGSLAADTGVDLFCGAVDQLTGSLRREVCQVHFIVTGFGSEEKIRALEGRCAGSGVRITFYPDASPEEYLLQFRRCHAALSLRLPESEMAMTTFPSKVVDITTQGLLLISTKGSDVPLLFDDSNAVLLPEATAGALASAIMAVIADPLGMQQVAQRGQARAMELFESKAVGKRIVDFVLCDNA